MHFQSYVKIWEYVVLLILDQKRKTILINTTESVETYLLQVFEGLSELKQKKTRY